MGVGGQPPPLAPEEKTACLPPCWALYGALRPATLTTAKQFYRWLGPWSTCYPQGGSLSESGLPGGAGLIMQIPPKVRTLAGALCWFGRCFCQPVRI